MYTQKLSQPWTWFKKESKVDNSAMQYPQNHRICTSAKQIVSRVFKHTRKTIRLSHNFNKSSC